MATSKIRNPIPGLVAGASFASAQYKVVKFASTAVQVIPVTSSTDVALGIIQDDPTTGQPALIAGPGDVAIAIAGVADLAQGERVGWNTTGQVDDTKARKIGIALKPSTAVGDYVPVLLIGYQAA